MHLREPPRHPRQKAPGLPPLLRKEGSFRTAFYLSYFQSRRARTDTSCVAPSSARGISFVGWILLSSRTSVTPRHTLCGVFDFYVIDGGAASICDFKFTPAAGECKGRLFKTLPRQMEAEHRFQSGPVQSACRACIPGPSPASDVLRFGIDVCGRDIRFYLIPVESGPR
jgi:hypothetical protein